MSHRVELPASMFIIIAVSMGIGYLFSTHSFVNSIFFWIFIIVSIIIAVIGIVADYIFYKMLQKGWYK